MTGAEAVAECLKAQGIELIFGIRGLHITPVAAAVKKRGLRFIEVRNEQSAAFMADAYARATGRIGVVLAGTGAGTAATMVGIQEAYCSSSPILLLASQIEQAHLHKGWGDVHEVKDQHGLISNVTEACYDVKSASDIPHCLHEIFSGMQGERPRPYGLEIAADILKEELNAPFFYQPAVRTPKLPGEARLEEAVEMIAQARRPVIYAGGGAIAPDAGHAITRLAELLHAPVLTSIKGKGVIPEDHDLSLGNLGTEEPVQALLTEADLAVVVGTRFSNRSTGKWSLRLPPRWVRIDLDERQFDKTHPHIQGREIVELVADARTALEHILVRFEQQPSRPQGFERSTILRTKRQTLDRLRTNYPTEVQLLEVIRSALRRDAIIANDSTVAAYWTRRYFEVYEPRSFLWAMGSGTIGFGLPAAIGAKLAKPESQVLALCGDGGFLFSCQELATAVKHRLAIVVLLFNDNAFGVVDYVERKAGHLFGDEALSNPDFIALAKSFGADAVKVDSLDAVGDALLEALTRNRLTVIEVPAVLQVPPDLA
ncbi:acetolactate synthase large subunit [Candidatus Methylomirabilis lanthanidiphila]|uniref:Acetolactate synthase large subunit n=1 Tax=Candidatus Methylomirabilis lanthanidiphila TaxID=2211376 RepID=A0A564ZGU8_9BACT|nr:thiamine pyrophosphate-binding protein [Candidatus Methylomirabilis lanthanidiphila]VUZ84525.1 acetolactate synthase large subunit [Candidatus Methylomirabilis lanthanidiphila]